jgi:phage terminase Nu1 subunit (DNA packaging protein)
MKELTDSDIEQLCKRYPLPEGMQDCVMTREQLAYALNTTLNSITSWLNKGMPALVVGGQGSAYQLQLSACWAWRQAYKAEEDQRVDFANEMAAKMRLHLVGGSSGDSIEALDPKSRKEIYSVQIEHERFQKQRNELLERAEVQDAFAITFGIIRDEMNAAPDVIERKNALDPKSVQDLVDICDTLVVKCRDAIERYWQNRPVKEAVEEKRDLFDA